MRTQYHREALAEYSLRQGLEVECFLPRIRYRKGRRPALEPLFPGYLFACFELQDSLRKIHYCQGVRAVVHFGTQWPVIPAEAIEQIRRSIGAQGIKDLGESLLVGDEVEVIQGPFNGFEALVTRLVPAQKRIAVLLEFLGRQTATELDVADVRLKRELRTRIRQSVWPGSATGAESSEG